jgi:hypothetical protein
VEYTIGLIHLNWFTKLQHVPHALKAFERCLALMRGKEKERPTNALVYQALGDALVKSGDFPRGRHFWKEGLQFFQGDRGLQERLGLTSLMVNRYVEETRSWASVQDTTVLSKMIGELEDFPAEARGG